MKKTIICNIPMKLSVTASIYLSDDLSLPTSNRKVVFPVNALLEETISKDDEIKIVLILKEDEYGHANKNKDLFLEEIAAINEKKQAKIKVVLLNTYFSQSQSVHESVMSKIVDEIENGSHLLVDITYGPKDLPIIIFTALGFAEKFLNCDIDGIIYGQASFVDGQVVNTKLCDMSPLYYLSSVTNSINCDDPDKARKTLKTLLSL